MKVVVRAADSLRGEVTLPGDKSISHRAVIFNSIAGGVATLGNFSRAADCAATVACMRALGVTIEARGDRELVVTGVGRHGLREAGDVLDAGNSGTTMRLLAGLLAGQPFLSVLTGDASLRSRPMDRVIEPLRLMGAEIWGRHGDSRAPLAVRGGGLRGITYELPVASAQLKSAIFLAGLYADGETIVREAAASRDHSERLLAAMGAPIRRSGDRIAIAAGDLRACDLNIPGDVSSAAFWLVAGAIHPDAEIALSGVGVNPTRTGIIDVLRIMGARLTARNQRVVGSEPVADMEVQSSSLTGVDVGGEQVPRLIDEIPLIALAGCFARGKTVIRDARELRVKETDRIAATVQELRRMGAEVDELPDGMVVYGGRKLRGCRCDSGGDHRLAMMLGIAGLVAEGETEIVSADAAQVSYPEFWDDLERLSAG